MAFTAFEIARCWPNAGRLITTVTLITVDAVVNVPVHIRVAEIVCIIAAMASGALENGIVVGVDVARRAHAVRVAVRDRELRVLRMVEGGVGPSRRRMASRARRREELRLSRVARIGGVVVIGLMATDASCRQRGVVAVDVAICTLPRRYRVQAGQREGCVVVVEGRVCPDNRVMAQLALLRETGRHVVRVRSALVIRQVAGHAQRAVQIVVAVDVAIGASPRRHHVVAGPSGKPVLL